MGRENSSISQEVAIRFINELKARGFGALPIYNENGNVKEIEKIRVASKGQMSLIHYSPTYLTNVSEAEKETAINLEYIWNIGLAETEAEMQSINVGDPVKHQLFGNSIDGNESIYEIMEQIKKLSNKNINIYKASIPIRDTAGTNKLDISDKSNFDELIQRGLEVLAEEKNLDLKNIKWVGAVHNINNFPHIQIALWDDSKVMNIRHTNPADINQIGNLNKEYGEELCTIDCEKNTIVYQDNISGNDKFKMDGLLANIQEQHFANANQIDVKAEYKAAFESNQDDEMEL